MQNDLFAITSVVIISLLSIITILPFYFRKNISKNHLLILLSFSVGALLGVVFFHLLPEIFEHGYDLQTGILILAGFITVFLVENYIHRNHSEEKKYEGHKHAYALAPINLIGDALHNFLDGLIVAASYAASFGLGVATTISVIFHELPQEIADFGILLYSGLKKKEALIFNFLAASTAILGVIIGIIFANGAEGFMNIILPIAVGNFLYIAASNLLPELHKHCGRKETILHLTAIILGIILMIGISFLE